MTPLIRSSKINSNRIIIKVVDLEWLTKDYKIINSIDLIKNQTEDQNTPKDPPAQNSSIKSAPAVTKRSNKSSPPDRTSNQIVSEVVTRKTINKKDHMVDPEPTVTNSAIKVKVNIDQSIELCS